MSLTTVSTTIERITRGVGQLVSWLTLAMVVVMFVLVALRYFFDTGWIWLQESVTWMHAAVFLLGSAYASADEEHVRVDIFYRQMTPQQQALVNIAGTIIFLLPFTIFMIWSSWSYVELSWGIKEASQETGGIPYPWVPLLKTFIPVTALLLLLQGLALVLRSVNALREAQR